MYKYIMDKIHQNLENIEKYLMVAQLENTKMNNGNKSSGTKLRSYLQNITKECSEARRLSLEAKHNKILVLPVDNGSNQMVEMVPLGVPKTRGRKPVVKAVLPVLHPSAEGVVN